MILARCPTRSHHPDWVKLAGTSCAHHVSRETPRADTAAFTAKHVEDDTYLNRAPAISN
jgi:hypothetical protein